MSKKSIQRMCLYFVIFIAIGISILTGSASDKYINMNSVAMDYAGIQGVTAGTDGPFVRLTTRDEIQKLYDSLDSTGEYTYTIPTYVVSPDTNEVQESQTVTITANIDESRKWDLTFEYIIVDGKKQLVTNGAIYSVTDIPGRDEHVISYNNILLLLDLEKETLTMYTSPTVSKYSYTDTIISDGVARSVLWADKPSFNKSGTKMIYYSERAGIEQGLLWVMDTITLDENLIPFAGRYTPDVLQWYDDKTVYILGMTDIIKIDVELLTAEVIYVHDLKGLSIVGFSYPYLFIPKTGGSRIINLSDGNITSYNDTQYPYINAAESGRGYDTLLIYQKPNEGNGYYCEAVVLNMQTCKKCVITVPEKDTICGFRMYNDDTIIVNVAINSDKYNQMTYLIPYDELVME